MTVLRSGTSITLQSAFFQVNYAGTSSGSDFTANGVAPLEAAGRPCVDGTLFQQRPGVSQVVGRFASGDQQFMASEVNSYVLNTGETVTYTWDWQAMLRN